jgi:hypothetical protein
MRTARKLERRESDSAQDLADGEVPAAVVCARCGEADCSGGCQPDPYRSGVIALVPWERPGAGVFSSLWATARASTFDAERFFESLPDGPISTALGFAVLSELVASTAMLFGLFVPVALLAPRWAAHLLRDDGVWMLRLAAAGIPLVASLLVAAHAAHGWALHLGAKRSGAGGDGRRALRFGLYAAGWDVVIGPLGAIAVAARRGPLAAFSIAGLATGLPTRSAKAFVRGRYGLQGDDARGALRASYAAAIVVTLVGAILVLGTMVWAASS